jgi:SH3 and multiple ankyrin repeat domains protein
MNGSSNHGTILIASNANTNTMPATAKITNINLNQTSTSTSNNNNNGAAEVRVISMSSVNSSLSSTSSSYSMSPLTSSSSSHHPANSNNKENESVNDMKNEAQNDPSKLYIRVSISDQSLQKVLKFNLDETVWNAKQRVLATLAKEVKDGLNYGFYLPPYQGRAGKFLDDCRLLKEYPLNGPVAQLEFKYKKRVYKFVKINQKELKALNVKSNYKRLLDLVRTNQVTKASRFLEKGLDPNFHSDLGETPLSVAASLAEPRNMIMALYNSGAHLDFRSRDTLTPMHKAAIIGNDKALKTLLELGAFAEVRDGRMLTPLYYSIVNSSSVQSIEYLLFNGSSIGVRDENNWQEIHHVSFNVTY